MASERDLLKIKNIERKGKMQMDNSIDSFKLLQIMRASQKRRNENARGERRRKSACEIFKKYFSFSGDGAGETPEQNRNSTSL